MAADLERLCDRDAVLSARESVLGVEERQHDQVESEGGEREVVAAEPKERYADDCRDDGRHDRCDGDGDQRVDAGVEVDEALVGIETDREQSGGVRADQEEGSLPERDLAREAHQQGEPERDERVQPHPVVEADVELRKLEREPAGEDRGGEEQRRTAPGLPGGARAPGSSRRWSYRQFPARPPADENRASTTRAMVRLYCGST